MKDLVFIPARAGSKGIKNKNLAKINNKPLIAHTIDFIKKIPNFIWFISTDGKKIYNISKKLGFRFNYLRPKKISNSRSKVCDAVFDAHSWLKKNHDLDFKNIVLLQPTSPIRQKKEFLKAYNLFKRKKLKSLASVTKMREFPEECVEIKNNKKWSFLKNKKNKNSFGRQGYSKNYFFIDGSFYIINYEFLKKHKKFVVENQTFFFKLNSRWPIDIDEKDDLALCDLITKNKNKLKIIQNIK